MKEKKQANPFHGSKRAFRNGAYASVLTVVVLAAVILFNLVIRALPTKYTELDISTSALFTLSDTSKNLLRNWIPISPLTIWLLPARRTPTSPDCWTGMPTRAATSVGSSGTRCSIPPLPSSMRAPPPVAWS